MRPLLALVLLLTLAPPAAAQEQDLVVEVAPPPSPLLPGGPDVPLTVTVRVSCMLMEGVPPRVRVDLTVPKQPAWTTAVLDPATHDVDPTTCLGGSATVEGKLRVRADPKAPAFEPDDLRVAARARNPQGAETGAEGGATVVADFAGELTGRAVEDLLLAHPGGEVRGAALVTSRANGHVTIRATLEGPGLVVRSPPLEGFVIPDATREVTFVVLAPENLTQETPYQFRLHYEGVAQRDESRKLPGGSILFTLLPEPGAVEPEGGPNPVPAPGLGLLLAALALGVGVVARRGR